MKIGVLGSGEVGQTLGSGFLRHGHDVVLGTSKPEKLAEWKSENPKGGTATFAEAARGADLIVLAVKGNAALKALQIAVAENLCGKIVIDATNPIEDAPPEDGLLKLSVRANESMMEELQKKFADVKFVKAFNSVGAASMVNPDFGGAKPTMFICGDDAGAKKIVTEILDEFGWETADMGSAKSARAIEPLCVLWCLPGFLNNEWTHAFKVLKR